MSAYLKSKELNLTGTDAEIVAVLQTLCASDLDRQDVATWMRERGLWIVLPEGHAGTLYDLYSNTSDPQIKAGLGEWYASTLGGQAGMIRTTWPDIAARVAAVAGLIAVAIPDGERLREEFYALAGGRPYATLTPEQFAAERAAATVADQRLAEYSKIVARLNYVRAVAAKSLDDGDSEVAIALVAERAWVDGPPIPEGVT